MKIIFTALILLIYFGQHLVLADPKNATLTKVSKKTSEFVSNLIPGEGDTEVSFDLREDSKPDYSILAVREIMPMENGKLFTQLSLFKTKKDNDNRKVGNIGFGGRKLFKDNTILAGINSFYDWDMDAEHKRTSLGFEIKSAVLDFTFNRYLGIENGIDTEKVLDGWEYQLESQVPYVHWANLFVNSYKWEGEKRNDTEGMKYGSELTLTPNMIIEYVYDNKDQKGLDDQWFGKLIFVYPGRSGPTAFDGVSTAAWNKDKDMSEELLTKVKRQNKIFVEFSGGATVSRSD